MASSDREDWHPADLATMDTDVVDILAWEEAQTETEREEYRKTVVRDGHERYCCPHCGDQYAQIDRRDGLEPHQRMDPTLRMDRYPVTVREDESIDDVLERVRSGDRVTDDPIDAVSESSSYQSNADGVRAVQQDGEGWFYCRIYCEDCDTVTAEYVGPGNGRIEQGEYTGQLVIEPELPTPPQ